MTAVSGRRGDSSHAGPDARIDMSNPHTLIIGGGIVGICSAYYLARRGGKVTLLEKDTFDDSASTGNAGLISVGHTPIPKPGLARKGLLWMFDPGAPLYIKSKLDPAVIRWLIGFARACRPSHFKRSMDVLAGIGHEAGACFRELADDESLEFEYRRRGELAVFLSEEGLRSGEHEAHLMRSYGYDTDVISGDELRRMDPAFRPEVVGAVFHRERAFANPGRFVMEMVERARRHGATLEPNAPVKRVVARDGRCVGAETDDGTIIEADRVVLAAGIWSSKLARALGVRIPMQPAKGYHLNLTAPDPCPTIGCVCAERYVAVTPMDDGLRLAGTLELSGINDRLVQKRLDMLRIGAGRYLHGIDATEIRSQWCGLRPCTADGLPVIGWAPHVGSLFIATGHAMMGFVLGPVTGKAVAACILGDEPSLDLTPLDPARFA
jgi:D-amino-acid dehydrogenase